MTARAAAQCAWTNEAPSIVKSLILWGLMAFAVACGGVHPAFAHPHMYFDSTAQLVIDGEGRLARIHVVFLVDELNTLYTLTQLGARKRTHGRLSAAEKVKVEHSVYKGFTHYDFFTHLADGNGTIALEKPGTMKVAMHGGRLGIAFDVPLAKPIDVAGRQFALRLYDPTYFTAITLKSPPRLIGHGPHCAVQVIKAAQNHQKQRLQAFLAQLSREQTPNISDVGGLFTDTARLTCRK
ncbi:MAG: DUF1007 family protein [Hyphomicrobiaceae bacterium]